MAYQTQNTLALAMMGHISDDIELQIGEIARLELQLTDRDRIIDKLEGTIDHLNEQLICCQRELYDGGGVNGYL